MPNKIQAIRGMNDILPDKISYWHHLEAAIRQMMQAYAYQEIRTPTLEKTELFKRSIGEVTDIVEKEMYTFEDRNGDSLTLRPEGTASVVRAGIEHGFFYNQIQKLWYLGPIYRHERPQKGRYRQFYQFGAEAFGINGPYIDVEMILMNLRLWNILGISEQITLQINTLGSLDDRNQYKKILVKYFQENFVRLDEDSQRRLATNPLRILDSKNPAMRELIQNAPKLIEYINEVSLKHFETLQALLKQFAIKFEVNPCLVRGLDYYCDTVFEWVTDSLGAQGTVSAGGRYDGLVAQLGGQNTPAVGFAMGCERVIELLKLRENKIVALADIYIITTGDNTEGNGLKLAENIHDHLPEIKIQTHLSGGSLKSQFKKADKSGAKIALILGEKELKENKVSIKYLREEKAQETVTQEHLIAILRETKLMTKI